MTFADIQNRVYFFTGTSSTSYSATNLTLAVNRAIERVISLINRNDSKWQYDDSNYTNLPTATATITSGQQQYTLSSTYLTIDRIEIKDSGGSWRRLTQIDQQDLKRNTFNTGASGQLASVSGSDVAIALGEATPSTGRTGAYKASTGVPTEYELIGLRLFLFPVPNYTQSASLRVYFTRTPLLFDYSDNKFSDDTGSSSSEPGFVSLFHDLIPLWTSYDYGLAHGKQNTNQLFQEILRKEQDLVSFYASRNRDNRGRLAVSNDSNK